MHAEWERLTVLVACAGKDVLGSSARCISPKSIPQPPAPISGAQSRVIEPESRHIAALLHHRAPELTPSSSRRSPFELATMTSTLKALRSRAVSRPIWP